MTTLKLNLTARFLILTVLFFSSSIAAKAQGPSIRLSVGAGIGYAPIVTLGQSDYSGVITSINGDLEYGKLMGRLQYSKPIIGTFDSNSLKDGNAYHGSLGYKLELKDNFFMGLLLSGGATAITYSNGFDEFTNVSPQAGVQVIPVYHFSKHFSVQASVRYYKGFEAGDRGRASDLFDLGIGVRVSL
ncbi:MAG: hypothetical protein Sapg2KO_02570 [Saprospiraceae bacterium]